MKTLRVTLADITGPTGTPNSTATVHARYVDTSGRGRDVHLTDGTIVVPVRRTVTPGTVPQHFDFDVYANDVAPVREVDYGHLVEVSWTVVAPTGAKTSGSRRVAITDDTPGVVQLGLLSTPTPVPPYTGGYVLPGELDALDARVVVLEEAPGGGGGGGAVDSVNGETGVVVLDAADVGADPAGTAAGLVGALIIPDSPDDIGAATAAQGAKADTAVQPAALAAYATDAELAVGLGTKANTSHGHAIADTTGLQAALDGKQAAGSYAAPLGADDNYVTDAEKAALHAHSNKAALDLVSGTNTGDQVLPTWSTISGKPAVVAAGATQADARTAIGAGTSSLAIGTTGSTAAAGNRAATETATGMVELATTTEATTGTDTVRAVTPAGVKAVADTKANVSHTHTASQVSDSTTTGRALLTAADAAAARTTLGLGTAATTAATAYATAAQGATADAALPAAAAPELIRDTMAAALVAGANVTITPNDGADTITIAASGGGGGGMPNTTSGEDVLILGITDTGNAAQNTSILVLGQVIIPVALTFTSIACEVTSAVVGSTVSLCLCTRSGATLTKVFESSALDATTEGVKTQTGLSQTLAAGVYWVGSMAAGGTPAVRRMSPPQGPWAFPHFGSISAATHPFVYVAPEAPPFAATMTISDGTNAVQPALIRLGGVTY